MGVFINSGIGAQIVAVPESTYGVAPSLSAAEPLEFNSESLELKKTIVQGKGLRGGALHNRSSRRVLTNYSVSGGINLDLPTRYLNMWLYQMFGSKGQTLAALTEDGTTGVYKAVHVPGNTKGSSLCIQKGVPSTDAASAANPFTYTGIKILDWTISVATGAIASMAVTVDGRNELAGTGTASAPINGDALNVYPVPALATYTEAATNNVFHFREASLLTGTVATSGGVSSIASPTTLGSVRSAEVKYGLHMDTSRYFLGSAGFKGEPIENDYRDISGQFVIDWLNAETQYQAFASDTPLALELKFAGGAIGTSGSDVETLDILIPQVYLDGETPKVGGPAVVTQTCPFTGLDNGVDNPIQATYWTLDATT